MTVARRLSSAVLEEREQEFRADGHTPEVARSLARRRAPAVVRLDDHTAAHARLTAAIIRAARAAALPNQRDKRGKFRLAHGVRSRIPRQLAPRTIEAEYARKIIDQVEIVRRAFRPLLEALPGLLAAARAARGDAEPWGVVERRVVADLPIAIENPAGSVRRWRDSDGTEGETTMAYDYGFIEGAMGADGDEVDVYIGPDPDAAWVYVIHQLRQGFPQGTPNRLVGDPQLFTDRNEGHSLGSHGARGLAIEQELARWRGGRDSSTRKHLVDRGLGDAERLRDAHDGGALRAQLDRLLKRPLSWPAMLPAMLRLLHHDEVRRLVVESVTVEMVNDLVALEATTEHALHDQPVLQALLAAVIDEAVLRCATESPDVSVAARSSHGFDDTGFPWVPDEQKCMIGFRSPHEAISAYLTNYPPRFFGGMSVFSLADFKALLVEHLGGKLVHRMDAGLALARVLLERHDASDAEWVRGMVGRAWKEIGERMAPTKIANLARAVGKDTSDFQRRQLARQTKAAFSVDVATRDANVPTMIEHFVTENVSLITSIADRYAGDIEKIVSRAFTTGARHEDVAEEIAGRFGVHERHARLIARDQLGSLTGQVSAARNREIGVRRFIWETAKDERVRPEHAALDGQVFAYDNLPSEGLPGTAIGCRCGATPLLSDILDDASDEEAQA